jgi:inorganic pyrophosphatase
MVMRQYCYFLPITVAKCYNVAILLLRDQGDHDEFVKKLPKMSPKQYFANINAYATFSVGKSTQTYKATFVI